MPAQDCHSGPDISPQFPKEQGTQAPLSIQETSPGPSGTVTRPGQTWQFCLRNNDKSCSCVTGFNTHEVDFRSRS